MFKIKPLVATVKHSGGKIQNLGLVQNTLASLEPRASSGVVSRIIIPVLVKRVVDILIIVIFTVWCNIM